MLELAIEHIETFVTLDCSVCGVTFALTRFFRNERRDDHGTFYCPNGHPQHFPAKSDLEIEREKANRLRQQLDQAQAREKTLERQISAARGETTKLRKRVAAGVCPCCKRTFKQLAAHMASQHPEFPVIRESTFAG